MKTKPPMKKEKECKCGWSPETCKMACDATFKKCHLYSPKSVKKHKGCKCLCHNVERTYKVVCEPRCCPLTIEDFNPSPKVESKECEGRLADYSWKGHLAIDRLFTPQPTKEKWVFGGSGHITQCGKCGNTVAVETVPPQSVRISKLEEKDFVLYDNGIPKSKLISNDSANIVILAGKINEIVDWINSQK